ncbi:hypothetical protein [Pseudogemmobacter bohemicus]|uniref:hypothetical protein n=1 Tax=Pseudogemmobacter bohemicus TaxID=2250708 RepID=UPI000DD43E0B|nr:hypothetical protein [Pseudogemmobacter bohemicus]
MTSGGQAGIFSLAHGGTSRGASRPADQNRVCVANVRDSLPWFTPFEASDYWTLYTLPEEFEAHRAVTAHLLVAVTKRFGGGDSGGVTGTNGNLTDLLHSRRRDYAFRDFPQTRLVDTLPGKWNRED